jgi:glycine oxidase
MAALPVKPTSDVLVVGGGLVGCALARELASRGFEVTVVERGQPGEEASWAAAGLLSPQSDARAPGPFFDLGIESRAMYPEWTRELEDETKMAVGYRRIGILRCAFSEAEREELLSRSLWQRRAGFALAERTAEEIGSALEGRIAREVVGGVFFPEDGVVDNRLLARALALSAERRGVRMLAGTAALRFRVADGVCRGVETAAGELSAGCVVDAAGAWAGFDPALPVPVPVEPVRGQIVVLRLPGRALPSVIESEDVYLVPRPDGTVLAGATVERVGFQKEVTAGALHGLTGAAIRLVPELARARFVEAWSGLRPGTPDGLPLLGRTAAVRGLLFAAGHYRNGVLLAPVTARVIADLVTDASSRDLSPFSPDRFAEKSQHPPAAGSRVIG